MFRPARTVSPSIDDFRLSGWKSAIGTDVSNEYFLRAYGLGVAGAEAMKRGEQPKARVLWLLADLCSLRLEPDHVNEPLASASTQTGEAFSLSELTESEQAFLEAICSEIDDALLRARVADALWLVGSPRNVENAVVAVNAYREASLAEQSWFIGNTQGCWRRGFRLALGIKAKTNGIREEMEAKLLTGARAQIESGNAGPSMVNTLLDFGLARNELPGIAESLVDRGLSLRLPTGRSNHHLTRVYLLSAKQCLQCLRNHERSADLDGLISDSFVEQAEACIAMPNGSHALAAAFYADAVKALIEMPKAFRESRGFGAKLKGLHWRQRELAMLSTGDFTSIHSETAPDADIKADLQADILGKELLDALSAFAGCWTPASKKVSEETVRRELKAGRFASLFAAVRLSEEGRVVANGPAADQDAESEEITSAIWNKMVQDRHYDMRFATLHCILPSLRMLLSEHLVCADDLSMIVGQSGVVPADRNFVVTKGLKAGFDGDFIVALHLLVPQLENLVRVHLQNAGAKTITTDSEGLQMESGLSSLVKFPEMLHAFGPDLTFELRAAFCDGFGPNLRNEVAHGLMHQGAMQSLESIYAWWLFFRLVFLGYYR